MLRPGGSFSAPFMLILADTRMYGVVLSSIGMIELAVITKFNINFLNRPTETNLRTEGRKLKLGKRLAVIEVTLYTDGFVDLVAHAS